MIAGRIFNAAGRKTVPGKLLAKPCFVKNRLKPA
jgi:hypothetical protein